MQGQKFVPYVFSQGHLYQELLLLHVASCASISSFSSSILTSFAYRLLILHHSSFFCSYISAKVLGRTQHCIMNNGKHFQQITPRYMKPAFLKSILATPEKKKMQHNRYLYSQGRCQNKAAHAVPIAAQLMPTNRVQVKASKEMQPSGQEVFRKHMQSKLHKSTNLKCMSRWVSALGLVLQHCGVQLTSLFRNRS